MTVRLPIIGAALVMAVAAALPLAVGPYVLELGSRALAVGVLAASVAVLTGHAGLPTLGQVAPYAAGAYTAANLANHTNLPAPVDVIAAAVAGAVFAVVAAPILFRTRGVVTLMVTLAIEQLVTTAATALTAITGGSNGLVTTPPPLWWGLPALVSDRSEYWFVLAAAATALVLTAVVMRGRAGFLLRATRDNEARMRATGHPVATYLTLAYVGAGALAGTGGALLVIGQTFISVGDIGFDTATLVLVAVLIGGVRSLAGALGGAVVIVAAQDWLSGPWPGHGPLILGALFITAVYLLPDGAAAVPAQVTARLRKGHRP
jgi:branched-chain amino acid transport system permease protein